jgi:outer membrane protein OmpA-like peptidoglycan-associated protein
MMLVKTYLTALPVVLISLFLAAGCASGSLGIEDHAGTVAENLGPQVNTTYDDYAPEMIGNRLLFTSNRPTIEGYIQGDDFWFTDRETSAWSEALNYGGHFNTQGDEGAAFITPDGSTVFFVQCWTTDGLGDCDIYTARVDANGKWDAIRNLGVKVNSKYWDSHPYLSPDGSYLYFASNRPEGKGGSDIWRCKRLRSGKWGKAKNLGSIVNTSGDEKAPTLAPNGTDLFFSGDGHDGFGGYDLYRTYEIKRKWKQPQNLGRPFNSAGDDMWFRLSAREDTVFIASSREDGKGKLDLYQVFPNPFKDTTRYQYFVRGAVFDTVTKMGIPGASVIVTPRAGREFRLTANRSGRFQFQTELGRAYSIEAVAKDYHKHSIEFTVPNELYYNEYRKSLGLAPIVKTAAETELREENLPVAYFEFDKSDLLPEYQEMLLLVIGEDIQPLLDEGSEIEIVLDAHTDDRGTEGYNYQLSRQRGASVSKFLSTHGVPLSAIQVNPHGKKLPVQPNATDEGRQKNRRVEVRINVLPAP